MYKKLLVASVIIVTSIHIAFAKGIPYVGVGLGLDNAGGYNGLMGNLFTGYGGLVGQNHDYYIGAELFADVLSVPVSNNQDNRSLYGVGLSFIPGIMLYPDTMVYGRVGAEASRYHASNGMDGAPQVGIGIQSHMYKTWDIRFEYDRTLGPGFLDNFSRVKDNRLKVGFVYKYM